MNGEEKKKKDVTCNVKGGNIPMFIIYFGAQ